jgi:hypothetical protein
VDPEQLAEALAEAHPEAEPWETPWPLLAQWLADAGADPDDDGLVAAALTAWDLRRV